MSVKHIGPTADRPHVEQWRVTNLSDLLRLIEDETTPGSLLFRGQQSWRDGPLIPKLGRSRYRVPLGQVEERLLQEFRRMASPDLTLLPQGDWEWLALAQHHTLPTRLLDWTRNPISATWFAVGGHGGLFDEWHREAMRHGSLHGTVWILDFSGADPDADFIRGEVSSEPPHSLTTTKIYVPRPLTPRIRAQSGVFTAHDVDDNGTMVGLDQRPLPRFRLMQVMLRLSGDESLASLFDMLGITGATLFPGLDSTAQIIADSLLRLRVGDADGSID